MLPLARNAIAIKFAEDDPIVAKMVAHAFIMFEGLCTSEQAYTFYRDVVASPKAYDRVMQFVTMMLMVDEPLGTIALSKGVNKKHGKLLSDVRLVGEIFGFYDKDERRIFTFLIEVSSIGPNTARTMLSSMTSEEIRNAIITGDINKLKSIIACS